jgi:hypothetical protein
MSNQDSPSATEHFNKLRQFRQAVYDRLGNGRDALFELSDAVIQLPHAQCFAELSCAPAFRRKWSSAYEAVQDGRPDRSRLMQLYLAQLSSEPPLLLVGDHTAWPRVWAETLAGRSYQHQPNPISSQRPVTIGLGYSTLAIVPEGQGSWALPLLHERITQQKPVEQAAHQLQQVCQDLSVRPISLWDAEYGTGVFLVATRQVAADKLIRLRSNLCLEGPTKAWKGRGVHPKHGVPFNFRDPSTWWPPDQVVEYTDPQFGPVIVRIWRGLRFRKALDDPMIIAQVERLQAPDTRRKPRLLWLAWVGEPPPERWWSWYTRRYPIDHWYRFAKGRLHWTLPQFATPEQCDRWSDLMPLLTWELWLARDLVQDCPLPWQKPQAKLAPGRVCQSAANLLVMMGTPTRVCKTRGKATCWPQGRQRSRRPRYELIISEQKKRIRAQQKRQTAENPPKRGRPKKTQPAQAA